MRKIIALAKSDYKRRWNKPILIILYILTPVIISFIMWMAFGGGGESGGFAPLKLAIVNNDKNGIISEFLSNALSNDKTNGKLKTFLVRKKEAFELINKRKVSGIIIIPEKFSEKIFKRENTELLLIKNPTETIYPLIAETGLNIIKDGTNYILTIFKEEIDKIQKAIEKKEKIKGEFFKEIFDSAGEKIEKIIPLFKEQKIEIIDLKKSKKKVPLAIFFFAGMSFFFLFFISNAILTDMVKERNRFIIKRLFLSELKKSEYFFSRILSAFVFILTIEIILSLTGRVIFGLKTNNLLLLFLTLCISALILTLLSAIIMGFSNSERQVHNIGMIFVFVFAILGGSLIPVSILPTSIRKISVISPLYYMTESVISLILQNMSRFYNMLLIATIISAVLFILAYALNIRALKKVVK